MNEINKSYFLLNGQIENANSYSEIIAPYTFNVYEVIRIIEGVPLFCEDHYDRMVCSTLPTSSEPPISLNHFTEQIKLLCKCNRTSVGNIRVNLAIDNSTIEMHFIPHYYPTENDYRQGVITGLYRAQRPNPNIKANLAKLKADVLAYLHDKELFEVFYFNEEELVTEGSRSNVFFIKGKQIFTSPIEMVLPGITREKVLQCIKKLNLELIETAVHKNHIKNFDSAFLTGTSPKVLPIAAIDQIVLSPKNIIMQSLMNEYNSMVESYITKFR